MTIIPGAWQDWTGGPNPPLDGLAFYRIRSDPKHSFQGPTNSNVLNWKHGMGESDIVAFAPAVDNEDAG